MSLKAFSLCMCSVFLIGFEDLKVFYFPPFSFLFLLFSSFHLQVPCICSSNKVLFAERLTSLLTQR